MLQSLLSGTFAHTQIFSVKLKTKLAWRANQDSFLVIFVSRQLQNFKKSSCLFLEEVVFNVNKTERPFLWKLD